MLAHLKCPLSLLSPLFPLFLTQMTQSPSPSPNTKNFTSCLCQCNCNCNWNLNNQCCFSPLVIWIRNSIHASSPVSGAAKSTDRAASKYHDSSFLLAPIPQTINHSMIVSTPPHHQILDGKPMQTDSHSTAGLQLESNGKGLRLPI
ncbi:hypothetical protein CEUSTIGMA_g12782.t1 [Chlamydomonas eustigma]|uniref:Uncharacterized protein n=1 Tax=Chlamydomonas eustigma TaxID=1157962 RepID=A0A250XQN4_9CHLO|nr:hypothetical protein CEUSTIGMA_g12782.t1 [Chlamydomonas eustigma]|eukprot:GAX85365.1 hypothetical protein CEUSTIGMA_g12782.t1 [Chlamydomonas eustigma]